MLAADYARMLVEEIVSCKKRNQYLYYWNTEGIDPDVKHEVIELLHKLNYKTYYQLNGIYIGGW